MSNITQTITTQIEVRENGELTQAYKRKVIIKHTKAILSRVGAAGLDLLVDTAHSLNELFTPVKLDVFDHVYGTSLRAQWFAGKRTQRILAAKRSYGL